MVKGYMRFTALRILSQGRLGGGFNLNPNALRLLV
jgi:hypothetical protein